MGRCLAWRERVPPVDTPTGPRETCGREVLPFPIGRICQRPPHAPCETKRCERQACSSVSGCSANSPSVGSELYPRCAAREGVLATGTWQPTQTEQNALVGRRQAVRPGPGRSHSSVLSVRARPGAEGLWKARPVISLFLLLEVGFLLKIRPGFGHTEKFGGDRWASESECDPLSAASSWWALWPRVSQSPLGRRPHGERRGGVCPVGGGILGPGFHETGSGPLVTRARSHVPAQHRRAQRPAAAQTHGCETPRAGSAAATAGRACEARSCWVEAWALLHLLEVSKPICRELGHPGIKF